MIEVPLPLAPRAFWFKPRVSASDVSCWQYRPPDGDFQIPSPVLTRAIHFAFWVQPDKTSFSLAGKFRMKVDEDVRGGYDGVDLQEK